MSAFNQLVTEKKEIIANAQLIRKTLCKTDALREEKKQLEDEMAVVVDMTQNLVAENARIAQNQDGVIREFDENLWGSMVMHVTVGRKKEMVVTFRDGTEIQA